jgi:hypothetical protein
LRETLTELAEALGVADPAALAQQLTLLYDGALAQSRLDPTVAAVDGAKEAANALVDRALALLAGFVFVEHPDVIERRR